MEEDSSGGTGEKCMKKDFAWKWAIRITGDNPKKHFRCEFCDQIMTSGISRFKEHLAQTHKSIRPCPKVPPEVKNQCIAGLKSAETLKFTKVMVRGEIGGMEIREEDPELEILGGSGDIRSSLGSSSMHPPKTRGPMDNYVSVRASQTTLNSAFKKEERHETCRAIGRLFYTSGLAFNVANSPYYYAALEKVANYGPGFAPPSSYELRTKFLKEEVFDIQKMMLEHKKDWKTYGCTIMSDGWTDGKSRAILNFLVNSPKGTWFLKSIDSSASIKNSKLLLKYLNDVVDEIGEENVIQIITESASNYKKAGSDLMARRKKLWWTPCAAHCIDLLLEDISKLSIFEKTIEKAKSIVKFLYAHGTVLSLMRKYTQNAEIIRPAVTRFATCFLTLQSIFKQKQALITMFSSQDWQESEFFNHRHGIEVKKIILHDGNFWNHVAFCIKAVVPIVCVLREVDSEVRPAMGYIYELMDVAKKKIANNLGNNKRKYGPIWNLFDKRWKPQLHQPLYATGYYLNPHFRYEDDCINDLEIRKGLEECMNKMIVGDDRVQAELQLDRFERKVGRFGSEMALKTRKKRSPVIWWEKYGTETPELTKFATRVLSLTCSASGCERNWSAFEFIHTKKRNRLEVKRLHALVYVKYNRALRDRNIKRNSTMTDPILVHEIESDDEWITEQEPPTLPAGFEWFREELNGQMSNLNIDAVIKVPLGTYESSLTRESVRVIEPAPREPTPPLEPTHSRELAPREPTPPLQPTTPHESATSLHEPLVLRKRNSQMASSSRQCKKKTKYMNLKDIEDEYEKTNPYDDTNPLFQVNYAGNDSNVNDNSDEECVFVGENDKIIGDRSGGDSLGVGDDLETSDNIDEEDLYGNS